jgi:hypothetical protein
MIMKTAGIHHASFICGTAFASIILMVCYSFSSAPPWFHPLNLVPTTTAPLKETSCRWCFVNYSPSVHEQRWTAGIATLQHDVCAESNKDLAEITVWMREAGRANPSPPASVFSHFVFENSCTGGH